MFRGARRADLDAILKIYARARQAMADSGNPTQWGDHFPPQELLEEDIDSNRLFLYLVNGELEGVFAFILGPDPTYARIEDGKWLNDTLPYGTIHRLASAGRHPGVAAAVITWCLEHCESLRADTHADNKIMQHLLEENGFTKCGIIHVEDGTPPLPTRKCPLPCLCAGIEPQKCAAPQTMERRCFYAVLSGVEGSGCACVQEAAAAAGASGAGCSAAVSSGVGWNYFSYSSMPMR